MRKLLTKTVILACVLAGCRENPLECVKESESYYACVEVFDAGTKTAIGEERSIIWSEGDRIAVFEGSDVGKGFRIISPGSSSGEFSQVEGLQTKGTGGALSGTAAVYPFDENLTAATGADGSCTINGLVLPSEQRYREGSFDEAAFPMTAFNQESGRSLSFRNVCGLLKLSLTGDFSVSQITVEGNSGELLSGKATVTVGPDGIPSVTMSGNASGSVILNCDPAVPMNGETATDFYVCIPPTDFRNGFTITVADTEGNLYRKKTTKRNNAERSAILAMPMIPETGLLDRSRELKGSVIGSRYSMDYNSATQSTSVNTKEEVFDGNFETFFASYDRSGTWVGLDLGSKHIITNIGYSPRIGNEGRMQLAIVEGANEPDFSDALPIYMIKDTPVAGKMHYDEISCTRGFRYVRYVTPNDARCNLAELRFYGVPGDGDDSRLYQLTNLPTVIIHTPGAEDITSKEVELSSNVYIISEDGTDLLATTETGVRGRGNASWEFPKKPYRLKFSKKQSPLNAPASAKKWTLINNYGDKTLMRNIIAFEVSRIVGQSYTPFCHPVDLVLNGEYRGCYQLCDQVEAASGRVEAKDGYLIEIDAYAYGEEVYFESNGGTPVTVKHPDEDDITSEQKQFIKDYYNSMEQAVFASNFTDPTYGYRRYLDLDSFLRHFLIGEFSGNSDTYWSAYMYKDGSDGKLFSGPCWDFDLAFENDKRTYPINNWNNFLYAEGGSTAGTTIRDLVTRIIRYDPAVKGRLIEIWETAITEGGLNEINTVVDRTAELLQESQELNFKRWDILGVAVHQNNPPRGSYEGEVDAMKQYIEARLIRLDQLINGI